MTSWKPIETAPKDEREILLGYFPKCDVKKYVIAYWNVTHQAWCNFAKVYCGKSFRPTHWMPLPEPPYVDE